MGSRVRGALLAAALAGALALWLRPTAGAPAASPQRIIALLNAERARNGIPAGIVANTTWTADCNRHNHYEQLNDFLGHTEIAGASGYSADGKLAAMNSTVDVGAPWGPGDPYDNAPFHLFQLLAPPLAVLGAKDSYGHDCVTTLLGDTRPSPAEPLAYSYPGNGRTDVEPSERADELPTTPAQELGLGSAATGPNLFVYFDGPWAPDASAHVTSATISGPNGAAVAVRFLDNTTAGALPGSYPTGAIIVPVSPLLGDSVYNVAVSASVSGIAPLSTPPPPTCTTSTNNGTSTTTCTSGTEDCVLPQNARKICGLPETWTLRKDFSFTTAARG
jgi:hypothetical protein